MTREQERLELDRERKAYWKRWGPYLSERAWGTVREDYSATGDAWNYFPFSHSHMRTYRWSEDGIGGICDRHQLICFALAMWNGADSILKERLFGLTGPQGNHGEDVKEQYFYLDSTPTHSHMKFLYKYPQGPFPYEELANVNVQLNKQQREYEILDTGAFADGRYFDVAVEYAKHNDEEFLARIRVTNHASQAATLHLLPTVWFRNTWAWGKQPESPQKKPVLEAVPGRAQIRIEHERYGERWLNFEGSPELLFTENESNLQLLWGAPNPQPYVKDAFHRYVISGETAAVNPERKGTKAAAHYVLEIAAGATAEIKLSFMEKSEGRLHDFNAECEEVFRERRHDCDEFYREVIPQNLSPDAKAVMRQAFAGMLWSKQFYNYDVQRWLDGDSTQPPPPAAREAGRNHEWIHFASDEILSMPDKWEYPWFAAWDLAFHSLPLSLVDLDFAKQQLTLLCRDWYMHPNGQLPAYEWSFSDVNPPVHAWAAHRVYQIERRLRGRGDQEFLKRIFNKLLLNFTWWVNRKDAQGNNIFEGGFLGMDNIGAFDRSAPLPEGGYIEQSDGTSWMAMYCLNLLMVALDLALEDPAYEDTAIKFWEHYLYIARAMNDNSHGPSLWDEEQGLYFDVVHGPDGSHVPIKVRSFVGLIPLFAVQTLEPGLLEQFPEFKRRVQWYLEHRPDLTCNIASMLDKGKRERQLLSIVDGNRLKRILHVMLDESEFLSPYGLRGMSQKHREPYTFMLGGRQFSVDYQPAESTLAMFGGNSNWRGPVWFPVNYLMVEALQKFHHYFGDGFKVECPTGSGKMMNLNQVSIEISHRLAKLFLRDSAGNRPVNRRAPLFDTDPAWRDLVLFHEYFDGDSGAGLGASHQTGWTGLIAKLMQQNGEPKPAAGKDGAKKKPEAAVAVK